VYDLSVIDQDHSPVDIRVRRLPHGIGIEMPFYATDGAAGADVRSAEHGPMTIEPGQRVAIATGLVFEIPQGWEVQVRPRSGLAWRQGLTVVNAPGTIDSDFRGEVKILLVNLGSEAVTIERGDRVAQLILSPVHRAVFTEVEVLTETDRAEGGFGSTGRA
jgi:dUTP pyrophosphatase